MCRDENGRWLFDRSTFLAQRPRQPYPGDPHAFWPDTAEPGSLYENPLGTGDPDHVHLLDTSQVDEEGMVTMSTDIGPIRISADTVVHRLSWELAAMKIAVMDACIEHDDRTGKRSQS